MKHYRQQYWDKERLKLIKEYADKDIIFCEIGLKGCRGRLFCGFAHRHRRWYYKRRPKLLGTFEQTLLACSLCHQKVDCNKELLEATFLRLRGPEDLKERQEK